MPMGRRLRDSTGRTSGPPRSRLSASRWGWPTAGGSTRELEAVSPVLGRPLALGFLVVPAAAEPELDDHRSLTGPTDPRAPFSHERNAATILWIYAVIVAIWPIRYVVLRVILRGQEFLDARSPRFE